MIISLRKSLSETSRPNPAPRSQTLLAHFSNSVSCVTPRSSVMGSYSVRPGDLRLLLGSPPSRCLTTSVVRLSPPTLLTPATYLPSHFTRNLKFLYGSNRCGLTLNCAMACSFPQVGFWWGNYETHNTLSTREARKLNRVIPVQICRNQRVNGNVCLPLACHF